MFGECIKVPLRRSRSWNAEPVERVLDDNYGYLGSHGFRQCQSICYCMLRQLRPICWNEKMLVHAPPLDCSGDCFRYPNCACNFLSAENLADSPPVPAPEVAGSIVGGTIVVRASAVIVRGSTVVVVVVVAGGCVTRASISPRGAEDRSQRREGRTPTEASPGNSAIAPISDRLRLIDAYLYTTLRHLR